MLGGGKFLNGAVTGAFGYAAAQQTLEGSISGYTKVAEVGDNIEQVTVTGFRWTTGDFIAQYFFMGGHTIRLKDVGLAQQYENSYSVQTITNKFMRDTLGKAYPGYSDEIERGYTDVTLDGDLFSVGRSTLFMSASCSDVGCTFTFKLRDWFRDPLDIGVEVPGGTPYRINDDWQVSRPLPRHF